MSWPIQGSGRAAATRLLAFALTASLLGACSWLIGIEDLPRECSSSAECTLENEPICDHTAAEPACRACNIDQECKDKDAGKPICRSDGVCTPLGCLGPADCDDTPETPICDTSMGRCVRCNDADDPDACSEVGGTETLYCAVDGDNAGSCVQCLEHAHCNSDKPVCDPATNTCVGCTEHSQCAESSGACDGEACASEDEVIYVARNATDTATCSRAMPCGKLNDALKLVTAARRFIVIDDIDDGAPDNYAEHLALFPPTGNVTIIGNGAGIVGTENKAAIDVTGGADVTLVGLRVIHANTRDLAEGIHCQDSTISIETSIIRDTASVGVSVNGCSLTIERSMIKANDGGGIDVRDSSFSIVNSFITGNGRDTGATTSNFGGLRINNVDEYVPQFFAFNTVAENRAGAGALASGVQCSVHPLSMVTVTSSIIRKGYGGRPTLDGNCIWRNSNVEDGAAVSSIAPMAMGNNYMDCTLTDDGNGIFRIDAGTPCENAGQPDTGVLVDYEGKSRSATTPDMGADELDGDSAPAAHAE